MGNYNFVLDLKSDNTMSVIDSWIRDESIILEFGCANGRLTKHLSKNRNCHMTIVEIDSEAGKEASAYAEKCYIGKKDGDINNLFWLNTDVKYDYIIFADVLEHLSDPEWILSQCNKVIKDNGEILISIPNISHNSILIDLLNDRFCYTDSGLLDKTHIHFFTYTTFCQMISKSGLKIVKQHSIYSRVGWNEIDNNYSQIPFNIEKELRSRAEGSIYQYVFSVCGQKAVFEENKEQLIPLKEDLVRQEEASCFYWKEFRYMNTMNRNGKVYMPLEENTVSFSINSVVGRLRIDPLESNALIQVEYIRIKPYDQGETNTRIIEHNALFQFGNIFYFDETDPYFIIDTENFQSIALESVRFCFKLLDYRMSDSQIDLYTHIFNSLNSLDIKAENISQNIELEDAKKYIVHLEKDLLSLKNDFTEFQKNKQDELDSAKAYIAHLEKDIFVLKKKFTEYQKNKQDELDSAKAYIAHLEKDIFVLEKKFTEYQKNKEDELLEIKAYVSHLENDISILKADLSNK